MGVRMQLVTLGQAIIASQSCTTQLYTEDEIHVAIEASIGLEFMKEKQREALEVFLLKWA